MPNSNQKRPNWYDKHGTGQPKKPKRPRKPRPFHLGGMDFIFVEHVKRRPRNARRLRDWLTRALEWAEGQR